MVLASHYVSEKASGGDDAATLVADGSNHNLDNTVDTQSTSDDNTHPLSLEDDGTDDELEIYTDRIMSDDESQMDESAVSKIANNIKLTTSLEESSLLVDKLGGVSQSVINSYRPQRTAQTIKASTSDPQIMVSSDDIQEQETDASGDSRPTVESLLSKVCNSLNFDIAEVWLHKGRSYDLTHSHIRPKSISDSVYSQLEDIYHGKEESTKKFKHELSSSMCKWAKKTGKILWITTQTPRLSQALKYSISGVQMGVAVPVRCGGITATIIYFSMTSEIMEPFAPGAEDKLVAMSKKMLWETMPLKERHSRRSTM